VGGWETHSTRADIASRSRYTIGPSSAISRKLIRKYRYPVELSLSRQAHCWRARAREIAPKTKNAPRAREAIIYLVVRLTFKKLQAPWPRVIIKRVINASLSLSLSYGFH